MELQWNFASSNSDGSNIMDRSNCFLAPSILTLIPSEINPDFCNMNLSNSRTTFMLKKQINYT